MDHHRRGGDRRWRRRLVRLQAGRRAAEGVAAAAKPATPHSAPIYYKFDPAFVVNFGGEGSARYLQVTVEAMGRDAAVMENLKNTEPAVRNDLVMLFSGQDNATLMSVDGKEKLRAADHARQRSAR